MKKLLDNKDARDACEDLFGDDGQDCGFDVHHSILINWIPKFV